MGNYKGKKCWWSKLQNGLSELNLNKSEVKINIIDHGNAGVFGFFEREAEVEITPLSPMELKIKRLIPYLIGAVTIFMILIAVIIGVYSDKSTTVSTLLVFLWFFHLWKLIHLVILLLRLDYHHVNQLHLGYPQLY